MRTGICTLHQALTAEAESVVVQAINLARRRGHTQVTPLHVASAMLVSPTGFLRRACLYCHSHPLQCKALELCFNVALNRLPSSSPNPLLGPHYSKPSLSNALVAAFKRAQAHQRRGSIENQEQPILALKIEVEQLIISILDDPSVSRVMREAGFSSTQVKYRVEQTVSFEISSQTPKEITNPLGFPPSSSVQFGVSIRNEDVMSVLEELSSKRKRNTVIVGECLATIEGTIRCLIDKFEKGNVPKELSYLQFISLPLFSLRNHSKEEVEQKLIELRCIVKRSVGRGVILYLGDLKWVSEFWSNYAQLRSHYSPLEQIVMEIKRLGSGNGGNGRVLVMGSATFETYSRCKKGYPSLESIWELDPLALPLGSLNLTLNLHNDRKEVLEKVGKTEAISPAPSTVSSLPPWLQKYREESSRGNTPRPSNQENAILKDSCEKPLKFSASSPSSSNSISSLECNLNLHLWAANVGPKNSLKEHQFLLPQKSYEVDEKISSSERNDPKPDLLSNPNSSPNSASSSEVILEYLQDDQLMELNSENLRILCDALEKSVPWQKHVLLELATVILQQREKKEECWLFFVGNDTEGKEKVARELAKLVFGSQTSFVSMGISSFSSSSEESKNKRRRDEMDCSFLQRFGEAVNENPNRVFFIDDFDQIDYYSQMGMKKAIQNGSLSLADSEPFPLRDAIIILSSESITFSASKRWPKASPIEEADDNGGELEERRSLSVSLDLNISIAGDDGEILEAVDRTIDFSKSDLNQN